MNEFGRRLKLIREEKDMSLSELAEKVDSTKSALSRYENGKVEPGLRSVMRLAEYFKVSLDWMSGESDIKNRQKSKSVYEDVVNECIKKNITPENLEQLIELMRK